MSEWLVQDTAVTVTVGPFLDKTDGVTPETGLAGSMTVYLSKNGGTYAARTSAVAITHDRDGYYKVPAAIADVDTLGRLRLQVTAEATHLSVWENYRIVTQGEYNAATGAGGTLYVTAAQVRSFKIAGVTIDLTAYSTDEIEEEIALAGSFIEAICNDYFYEKSVTEYLDGNGLTELYFYPEIVGRCISVSSVTEVDDAGTTTLTTFTEDEDFKLYDHWMGLLKDFQERPRLRLGSAGRWPQGIQNIKVVGVFGRATVPLEIKRAAMLLTLERLIPGSTLISPKDVSQAVWPDFTITYRGAVAVGSTTGFPEVGRLLMQHINVVDMFLVVPDERINRLSGE